MAAGHDTRIWKTADARSISLLQRSFKEIRRPTVYFFDAAYRKPAITPGFAQAEFWQADKNLGFDGLYITILGIVAGDCSLSVISISSHCNIKPLHSVPGG
jgi:hypothetical protein